MSLYTPEKHLDSIVGSLFPASYPGNVSTLAFLVGIMPTAPEVPFNCTLRFAHTKLRLGALSGFAFQQRLHTLFQDLLQCSVTEKILTNTQIKLQY